MIDNQIIAAGDIISGLEPDELVEVRRVAAFGERTPIEGVTLETKHEMNTFPEHLAAGPTAQDAPPVPLVRR